MPTGKIPENRESNESLKEKLFRNYRKSTTTWPNDMPLEDMDQMVNFKCFSSRPEDAVARKVMERLMDKKSVLKQVCTLKFTLLLFKILSPHMIYLIQMESKNAKLKQKLSKFPSYSKVPKPFDPPDKKDFSAAKTDVYEAKLEAIKTVSKEN